MNITCNPDFFVERRGTRKYMIVDYDNASYSPPMWLTNKEKRIFDDYCVDTSIQVIPYSEAGLSKDWIMAFWQEAKDFNEEEKMYIRSSVGRAPS